MMAVSATAAAFTVMVVASLVVLVVTAAFAFVAAATATLTVYVVDEHLDLLVGSLAVLGDKAAEEQRLTCQRVVHVYCDLLLGHFQYAAIEVVAVLVLQGHYSTFVDVLLIELAVDVEDATVKMENPLFLVVAIRLVLAELEGEGLSLLQVLDVVLESVKGEAEASDEIERPFGCRLFYEVFTFLIYRVELVLHGDVSVLCLCHYMNILLIVCKGKNK